MTEWLGMNWGLRKVKRFGRYWREERQKVVREKGSWRKLGGAGSGDGGGGGQMVGAGSYVRNFHPNQLLPGYGGILGGNRQALSESSRYVNGLRGGEPNLVSLVTRLGRPVPFRSSLAALYLAVGPIGGRFPSTRFRACGRAPTALAASIAAPSAGCYVATGDGCHPGISTLQGLLVSVISF